MNKERISYIDITKGMLIVCVIVHHSLWFHAQYVLDRVNGVYEFLMYSLGRMFVPYFMAAFFVLATLKGVKTMEFREVAIYGVKRLLLPMVLLFPWYSIWFCWAMFFDLLLYHLLCKLECEIFKVGVMLVLAFIGVACSHYGYDYHSLDYAFVLLPFFYLGDRCKILFTDNRIGMLSLVIYVLLSFVYVYYDKLPPFVNHSETSLVFVTESTWDKLDVSQMADVRAFFSLSDFRCLSQRQGESIHITMRTLPRLFRETFPNGIHPQDICYTKKDDNEMIMLNYTSGTSGYSKGVMLTGDNFCCMFEFANKTGLGFKGCEILSYLPLAHSYGCTFDFMCQMATGGHVTFLSQIPSPTFLMKAMRDVRPHWIAMVPLVLETMYKKNIQPQLNKNSMKIMTKIPFVSSYVYSKMREKLVDAFGGRFKKMFVGGAPFNGDVEDFFTKIKFPFAVAYGMTECSPLISVDFDYFPPRSVGKSLDGIAIKINSKEPIKEPGEVLVKGRNVMKGYYRNVEATKAVFTEDGWLKTGDLGIMDENGYIYLKGRSKSMLLSSSGQNVYPEEIESKLNSMPMISESVVIQKGDKIVALVYPDFSVVDKGMDLEAMRILMDAQRREVNRLLADYEHISEFVIRYTEFEKTPKKSIKRYLYEN